MKTNKLPIGVYKRLERTIYEILPSMKNPRPNEIIEEIYKTVDFYYKKAVSVDATCKKGCSWCCRIPVSVSAIEVQYITDKTGFKATPLKKGFDWSREPDKTKCPFLVNDQCGIYEHRPFNCRIFASLDDPKNCFDGDTYHQIYTWESNEGLKLFRKILDDISEQYECAAIGDIRYWFGIGAKVQENQIIFIDDCD